MSEQHAALLARQFVVSVDAYFDLPQTIKEYQDSMKLGAMQNYILNRTPAEQRDTEAKKEAALTAFADSIHARVEVLITVP